MIKYKIGDLLVKDNLNGIITSLNDDDMWDGGGYYEIMWSAFKSGQLSYRYLYRLINTETYKLYESG